MKKLILIFLFSPFFAFSQDNFPTPFTFNYENFNSSQIEFYPLLDDNRKRIGRSSILYLRNVNSNINMAFSSHFPDFPDCPYIETINDFLNYKEFVTKNTKDEKKALFCSHHIVNSNKKKIYNQNGLTVFSLENFEVEPDNDYILFVNIVFYKDKFLSAFTLAFYNNLPQDKELFNSYIKTIKLNDNIKSIDFYKTQAEKYLEASLINKALENIISALFLEPDNEELKQLYENILKKEMGKTQHNIKELESLVVKGIK